MRFLIPADKPMPPDNIVEMIKAHEDALEVYYKILRPNCARVRHLWGTKGRYRACPRCGLKEKIAPHENSVYNSQPAEIQGVGQALRTTGTPQNAQSSAS